MSICLHCNGLLVVDADKKEEFINKLSELASSYCRDAKVVNKVKDTIEFSLYARHFFMNDFEELTQKYINNIEGKVWFSNIEGSGSVENPFPHAVYVEFVGGKMFEQTLWTRLYEDWDCYAQIDEVEKTEEEPREAKVVERNDDDDLPF